MYTPKAFEVTDGPLLDEFIALNSFATLVSNLDGKPFATHLPLVLDRSLSAKGSLLGHVAIANPHWHAFETPQDTLAIFQGPHAYISPNWYKTAQAVPTWNYAVVHVYGVGRLMDEQELSGLVDRLTEVYEAEASPNEPYRVDVQLKSQLLKSIVGFVLDINRIEGKFKLSQNRSLADQLGVLSNLERSLDPGVQALASLTRIRLESDSNSPK
jgi:transcriptional regulator